MTDSYLASHGTEAAAPRRRAARDVAGDPLLWPALAYLALCVMLGGSSSEGAVANAVVQGLGLAVIVALLLLGPRAGEPQAPSPFLLLGLAFVGLAIIQLVPLPPAVWHALNGREPIVQEYRLLDMATHWAPLSLSPQGTVRAIVSAIPLLAMLSLTSRLTRTGMRHLLRGFVVIVAVSAFLGLLQIGGWKELYFYDITNPGKSVGFFANSNHQATLMLVALPMIVATRSGSSSHDGRRRKPTAIDLALAGAAALVIVCAVATQSLAAIGLLVVAGWGSYLLWRADQIDSRRTLRSLLVTLLLAMLVLAGGAFFLSQVGVAASTDSTEGNRLVFAGNTLAAIGHMGLFGSGLGTFIDIYPTYQAVDQVSRTYVNHAHDDWLEFILETGVLGAALLLAAVALFGRAAIGAFRAPVRRALFARAATIGVLVIALHSLVDYPLRTTAMAAVLGMLFGLFRIDPVATGD